jgi:diketogulonate reductase-like aldo/keto reductase
MREQRMPLMAYSPLGQGELLGDPRLARIAATAGATPAQVALAWLLRQGDVMAIPQSCDPAHVRANRAAADLLLGAATVAALEQAFPAPSGKTPLAML